MIVMFVLLMLVIPAREPIHLEHGVEKKPDRHADNNTAHEQKDVQELVPHLQAS